MKKGLPLFLIFYLVLKMGDSFPRYAPEDEKSNYVVIGAFSIPKNAIEFTENAKRSKFNARFSINPVRKLFYVYVLETDNAADAIDRAKKIRRETPYSDTWVFTGRLGEENQKGMDVNPTTGRGIAIINAFDETETPTSQIKDKNGEQVNRESPEPAVLSGGSSILSEELPAGEKEFLFKILSKEKEIGGDVDVLDMDNTRTHRVASYRGNEVVRVKPVNNSGNIALVCEVFGYRKVQRHLNFNSPEPAEGVEIDHSKVTVPFELSRLKRGDIAIMYNVYFFQDAGVMRPESRYEVTSLLEMLRENPKYKICIHGHTNGNAHGKIISIGEAKNFFSLVDTKEGYGSAKKLSEERAKVIQAYLISQGIDPGRMQIKAWGGKRPIYKKDSQSAMGNVRVEIEILED